MKRLHIMAIAALAAVSGCDSKLGWDPRPDLRRRDEDFPAPAPENEPVAGTDEAKPPLPKDGESPAADKAKAIALAEQAKMDRQRLVEQAEKRAAEEKVATEAKRVAEEKARADEEQAAEALAVRTTTAVFYDALAQHGEWFDSDLHGFVWRPKSAATLPEWRPYMDGRWRWTEYGWAWQSNEPFGWAVYHYGRWAKLPGTGWVWVPGHEWAPAWVSWRSTRDAVGWAPLPPEAYSPSGFNGAVDVYFGIGPAAYGVIRLADFDAPSYSGKFLPPERQFPVIESSVNLTSIRYSRSGDRMILTCGGPSVAHIGTVLFAGRAKDDDPANNRMPLQLLDSLPDGAAADEVKLDTLILHAPQLTRSPAPGKPRTLAGRLEVRSIERGWTQGNSSREAIWRERIKADALTMEAREKSSPARTEEALPAPVVRMQPMPAPQPIPKPVSRPAEVANPAPARLAPARLRPASGLTPKRP